MILNDEQIAFVRSNVNEPDAHLYARYRQIDVGTAESLLDTIDDLKRQLVLAQAQVAIVDRSLGDLGDTSAQAALDAYVQEKVAEALLDFTMSAFDYFSKKSTTGQQGERGIYSRTYQKFGEFVNSEHPKLSANRNKATPADPPKEKP